MLELERLEHQLYEYVESAGRAQWRSVTIGGLMAALSYNDQAVLVDSFKDLHSDGYIDLQKIEDNRQMSLLEYRAIWREHADLFYDNPDDSFFLSGYFQVKVTHKGRRRLEELQDQEAKESQGSVVFISCGQYHTDEKELGKALAALVDELTHFRGYFAENQNTLQGLSDNIFGAINRCVCFIAVMHKRGTVKTPSGEHVRASVWIEQEIAIAAFLTHIRAKNLPVVVYIEKGIKREGVREQLRLDPVEFEHNEEVIGDLKKRIEDGRLGLPLKSQQDHPHLQ